MDLAHLAKDVLLLSKARSEVVAEQMARRVPHEVRVTTVRENGDTAFGMSQFHLWNPITEELEVYGNLHIHQSGARNTLVARGYVEIPGENGQPSGYGRFEALIPVRELQRIYMRPVKRARPNPSDIES